MESAIIGSRDRPRPFCSWDAKLSRTRTRLTPLRRAAAAGRIPALQGLPRRKRGPPMHWQGAKLHVAL
eukprot:8742814-Pyramimonas_sp.AAC.1